LVAFWFAGRGFGAFDFFAKKSRVGSRLITVGKVEVDFVCFLTVSEKILKTF